MWRRKVEFLQWMVAWLLILVTSGSMCRATPAVRQAGETPKVVLRADFEKENARQIVAPEKADSAVLTTEPNEVVAGKRSLKGDARTSNAEWNEFFHLRQGVFGPRQAYRVTFDYKVLARSPKAQFYALFRRAGKADSSESWRDWKGEAGTTGHIEMTVTTRAAADYYLIIGIQNQGALAIDNLVIRTDPISVPFDAPLPAPARTWKSSGNTPYYVDSAGGNDKAVGDSASYAWQTLKRVSSGTFAPGDRILLRAGGTWTEFLAPGGSGNEQFPITLDMYGQGAKPRIAGGGKTLATLYLHNVEHWRVHNLDIDNKGVGQTPNLAGVLVTLDNFGVARDIELARLDIHDVTGSLVKSEGGGSGIHCANGGDKVRSRFDGLKIENCRLRRTDRNGITMNGYWARKDWFPSLHVVIRGNLLEDIGGDGIVPIGCDGALVERNTLRGGRQRCDDYAAGIWHWSCDNTIIQFNEVSGMKGTKDGQGYDSDWNCRNTLFQYNYSHDNEGGFMLICCDGNSKMPYSIGNYGTVIRYNISQNDGARTFQITGPCYNTQIYNNVFYTKKGSDLYALQAGNWGGKWPEDTRFANNIFYTNGKANFDLGKMIGIVFDHNVFWGQFAQRPDDAHAILTNPMLAMPGSGRTGLDSLRGYALLPGSPCVGAGRLLGVNNSRDFAGKLLPVAMPPDIGALQH